METKWNKVFNPRDGKQVEELIKKVRTGVWFNSYLHSSLREDVVQDILLEAIRKQKQVTWLWIRRRCYDRIRKESIRREKEKNSINVLPKAVYENGQRYKGKDNKDFVDCLIRKAELSRTERTVVFKRYYKDLTLREIASETGMSFSHVAWTLKRVIEKLRIVGEEL